MAHRHEPEPLVLNLRWLVVVFWRLQLGVQLQMKSFSNHFYEELSFPPLTMDASYFSRCAALHMDEAKETLHVFLQVNRCVAVSCS